MTATLRVDSRAPGSGPTRRRPSRRVLLIAAGGLVAAAALAVWLLAFSSVLGARHVFVRGERTVSAAQVVSAAAIRHGTPLLRLDTAAVARRVARLPVIASASVRTELPSTVTISITERVAVGVVKSGAGYEVLDHTGVAFSSASRRPPGLPLLVVPLGVENRAVDQAVASVAGHLPVSVLHRTRSVQALGAQAITLVMRDGRVVHWGSAADTARKAELLPALLRQQNQTIDLSDPTQPFTR